MSRFANPQATKRFPLGDCECPGTPHAEGDWLALRCEFGADDLLALEEATEAKDRMRLLVKDWNLIGDDGKVAPLTDEYIGRLYLDVFPALDKWLTDNAKVTTLPNAPAAPSASSSPGSGSPTPTLQTVG